ncbi:hypothetical protein D3C72_2072790 [compost metagenome]
MRTSAFDRLPRGLRLDQHGLAMALVFLAQFGHREMPRRALQQAYPEAFFEQGDTPAELGLGHIQRPAGGGETTVLDHLGEVVEVVEIVHHRSPNRTLRLN